MRHYFYVISGHVPLSLKIAVIKPSLKETSLDPDNLDNYRPISNLPFLSKYLKKEQLSNSLLFPYNGQKYIFTHWK